MFSAGDKIESRTWKIAAQFSLCGHNDIYDSHMRYLPEYIGNLLAKRLQHMQKIHKSMKSITLLSVAYPRQFRSNADVPVIVMLHFSNSIGSPAIEALLGRGTIVGIAATCTPVYFEPENPCSDVTLHPIFATFLGISSKDTGPGVNQEIYIRVDIMGDSDAKQETKETRCRSWAFEATFAFAIHPALATDCDAAATTYIRNVLRHGGCERD